jgi:uncharacterized membrane protein YGL010W
MIGIPLIMAGLLGLLAVPLFRAGKIPIEASLVLLLAAGAFDLWLDLALGATMIAFSFLLYLGARLLPWPAALSLFLVGWIFQFIGHGRYEKRSPAFLDNLTHLLVGPMWVLNHLVRRFPEFR